MDLREWDHYNKEPEGCPKLSEKVHWTLKDEAEAIEARVHELEKALRDSPCKCRWSYDHAASVLVKCPRCAALNL